MKKDIDCSTLFLPSLCLLLGVTPTIYTQCISCVQDGKLIAGALYENFNRVSIGAHLYIAEGKLPSKEWYAAIFDYPFNQLGVRKIVGQVFSTNVEAQRLDEHLGFVLEAIIKDHSPNGDLFVYTMTRDQCRVLNSPRWANALRLVSKEAA